MLRLVLAACLIFALALSAYAFDFLGIREMLQRTNQQLPDEAYDYIQSHDMSMDSTDWRCDIVESLCDEKNILITIAVTASDDYILAPTDAGPESPASIIGLDDDRTLGEYAAAHGKKLLCVGAGIQDREALGIAHTSQAFESTSVQEMTILLQAQKTVSSSIQEVVCVITAVEETAVREHIMGVTLVEAPTGGSGQFIPHDPTAVPGITVGNATVAETPLGISIRFMQTITDEKAFDNFKKVEFDGLTYGEGGLVLEDDGNWWLTVTRCTGTVGNTLTARFYDLDGQLLGTIEFVKN